MAFTYYHPTDTAVVLSTATALTSGVSAAATSLPVSSTTGTYFVTGRKLLLGSLGDVNAELVDIANIPGATTFTTEAVVHAHSSAAAVTSLLYDSVRLYTATSADGPWTLHETRLIDVTNSRGTYFQYTGSTATHFRFRFYHSVTGAEQDSGVDVVSPADDASYYTTIAAYKTYAGITGVDRDEEIFAAIGAATAAINSYLFGDSRQSLLSATYTEKLTVGEHMQDILVMQHSPITGVTSITQDTTVLYDNSTALIAIDTYDGYCIYLDNGLQGSGWASRKPLTVVYTAGYSTVPADVALACRKLVTRIISADLRDNDGIAAYSLGPKSVTFDTSASAEGAIPPGVQTLLAPYKRSKLYRWG